MNIKNLALATCLTAMSATSASAIVLITAEEVGSDVVFNLSGSYDVSEATFLRSGDVTIAVNPADRGFGLINFGPAGSLTTYDIYEVDTSPSGFGPGGDTFADSFTGDLFSLNSNGIVPVVGVAPGTTTGTVSGSLTFAGSTFGSLGVTEGVYDWTWAGDSARLQIGDINVTPVPLPAGAPLLLAGLAAFGIARRRKKSA